MFVLKITIKCAGESNRIKAVFLSSRLHNYHYMSLIMNEYALLQERAANEPYRAIFP